MSLVLGLDAATPDICVAVSTGEPGAEPVSEILLGPGDGGRPRHGKELMVEVERAVEAAGGWGEIELIAVGVGPGSFTGLRIGVATARALAHARELPLAGVQTTAALAASIAATEPARPALAVIDARRSEIFAALRHPGSGQVESPVVCPPERLSELVQLPDGVLAAGDGAVRFREELEAAGIAVAPDGDAIHRLPARFVCSIGRSAGGGSPTVVEPLYLRRPDAERWLERDAGN